MQSNGHNTAAEYVRSFQNGEEKGFNFFFREYYAALSYFSFQIIKDKPEAEEIAGEALMKLWERHTDFDTLRSIKSFLYTTARNASLNWVRQQKKGIQRAKELAYLAEESESPIMQQIIEIESYREIFLAINTLPPKCRQIFQMLFFEGKDYKQIAQELNLSIDTIRNQKARALMLIRERVAFGLLTIALFQQFILSLS